MRVIYNIYQIFKIIYYAVFFLLFYTVLWGSLLVSLINITSLGYQHLNFLFYTLDNCCSFLSIWIYMSYRIYVGIVSMQQYIYWQYILSIYCLIYMDMMKEQTLCVVDVTSYIIKINSKKNRIWQFIYTYSPVKTRLTGFIRFII